MPNTVLTQTEIRDEIQSRLGGSRLTLELDQKDFDIATKEAVRIYSRHVPFQRWRRLDATASQKRYVLATVDHPGMAGVLDVQFITRRTDPTQIDPFNPFDTVIGGLQVGDETFGDVEQRRAYTEDASRIVSAEPEWRYERELGEHVLYVDVVRVPTQVSYLWVGHFTSDADASTGMQLVPDADTDWVLDYVEARMMVTLGRVRRKFGGIPNPDGGVDEIDGQQFVDEGQQKIELLAEEIRQRRFPLPPAIE